MLREKGKPEQGGHTAASSPAAAPSAFPPYAFSLMKQSFAFGLIPPLVLLAAIAMDNLTLLIFAHVMSAVMWTGFDLFMAVVLGRVLRNSDIAGRVEIAKRLTPSTFFIVPSLAATTITAGIYLAMLLGVFNLSDFWIIAALAVITILTVQGFGILMPNSMRIFIELAKPEPDRERIAGLNWMNIRLAGVQGALQVAIVFVMVNIANLSQGTPQLDLAMILYSLLAFAVLFLAVYLSIFRGAYLSYKRNELDKRVIDLLWFGLAGHIVIFLLLGLTLLFARP